MEQFTAIDILSGKAKKTQFGVVYRNQIGDLHREGGPAIIWNQDQVVPQFGDKEYWRDDVQTNEHGETPSDKEVQDFRSKMWQIAKTLPTVSDADSGAYEWFDCLQDCDTHKEYFLRYVKDGVKYEITDEYTLDYYLNVLTHDYYTVRGEPGNLWWYCEGLVAECDEPGPPSECLTTHEGVAEFVVDRMMHLIDYIILEFHNKFGKRID